MYKIILRFFYNHPQSYLATQKQIWNGDGSFQNFIMKINEHLATKNENEKTSKFPSTYSTDTFIHTCTHTPTFIIIIKILRQSVSENDISSSSTGTVEDNVKYSHTKK